MCLGPQAAGGADCIHPRGLPPSRLIAMPVQLTVMQPTHGYRELVTDLAAERALLDEAEVVGVARASATDQAGLPADEPQVFLVAQPRLPGHCGGATNACFSSGNRGLIL